MKKYKHVIFVFYVLLFISNFATSQTVDALKQAYLTSSSKIQKVEILLNLGTKFNERNIDSSLYYNFKAYNLSKTLEIDSLIAASSAKIAISYLMKGSLDISMKYELEALKIHEANNNEMAKIKILNNIGLIYFYQSKLDEALINFNKVLQQYDLSTKLSKIDKSLYKGKVLNNIGIIYEHKEELDKSLEFYTRAITYSKLAKDEKNLASIYSNMGILYLKMNKYNLSEAYLNDALKIRTNTNDLFGECKSYQHLGKLYQEKGDLQLSEKTLLLGLNKCEKAEATKAYSQILNQLSQTYSLAKDYENAYKYQKSFIEIKESLTNSDTQRKITEAEMQFKFDKESDLIAVQHQKKQYLYIVLSTLLLFAVVLVVGLYLLQKSKIKNQLLEKEKVELENKELFFRKQTLELELESRSKDLTTNVMYLIKKNELICEISDRLISLKKMMKKENQKDVQKIIMDLQLAKDDDVWQEFEVRFNQVYNDFYERLNLQFPNLTINEKKICAFLKLNMTTKEICTLTRQSTNSLNVARTRLRKKLGLNNTNTNLTSFLESI